MKFDKRTQNEAAQSRRSQQGRELHLQQLASARLKTFAWGDERLGIRRKDVSVFKTAASVFDRIVLVRSTNQASLVYIGDQFNFCPKPIDCKAKTADKDVYVDKLGILVNCAGLVVDPELLGAQAFKDSAKYEKSLGGWRDFTKINPEISGRRKIFERRGERKGFFAVDLLPGNRYGCLMVSEQDVPDRYFNVVEKAFQEWKGRCLRYLHADYDLYALIDPDDPALQGLEGRVHGMRNIHSPIWGAFRDFVNAALGAEMIQHGEQVLDHHQDDIVFVFYPSGVVCYFDEPVATIEEIFRLLYGSY